jgi:hypothetical protein
MIKIYNKETNEFLGRISEEQWKVLADHLEEESSTDKDYFIKVETLDELERLGADPMLVSLLRAAMKPRDSIEIRWEEETLSERTR